MHGPFKKNICDTSSPLSHSATVAGGFHSQKLWRLLFLALQPWAREPVVGLGHFAPQGQPLQPRYLSQFLTSSPFCVLTLLPASRCLLYILSYKTSGNSQWWFCSLVIILMWSWKEASTVFTYFAILTGRVSLPVFLSNDPCFLSWFWVRWKGDK